MIVVKLIGGMGNQMAQYAFGRYLSELHGVPLKLDIGAFEQYKLHRYSLGHLNILEDFATVQDIRNLIVAYRDDAPYYARTVLAEWAINPEFDPRRVDLNVLKAGPNVYLDGYWGSEAHFKPIEALLRQTLSVRTPLAGQNLHMADSIQACNAVSVHYRRGDYVTNPDCLVTSEDYYRQAVKHIADRVENPHFFIFSDEPQWLRENFRISHPFTVVDINNAETNYEDMRLMNLCQHNIIANSTFSWWGAWLNANPAKIVVAPYRWFKRSDFNEASITPPGWIRLREQQVEPAVECPAHMVVGVWNCYEELNRDGFLFKQAQVSIGENLLKPLNDFFNIAKENGVALLTLDQITDFNAIDAYLFLDYPNLNNPLVQQAFASRGLRYLVTYEPEVVKPENWLTELHGLFERVFTWNDHLVDNDKYIKIHYAQDFERRPAPAPKDKFCTLIAGAKGSSHPAELYSERVNAIRWFEANHPDKFDLYGVGWDPSAYPSYRGRVDKKLETLQRYRFAICYENAQHFPGYITEKIFDCFKARCVPVYWGAPNIDDYLSEDCYIDKRKFSTYEALYAYLNNMPEADYQGYLDRIERYLGTVHPFQHGGVDHYYYPFTAAYFSWTVLGQLARDRDQKLGTNPLVSIIVTTYNYGKYVAKAIASAVTQDVQNLEVIVLDNASTDDTEQQVTPFLRDSRVRYMRHASNLGSSNNWQRGLQLARGKYVVVLAADDFLLPGHLSKLLTALEHNPHCALAYTPCVWVDDNDHILQVLNHVGHLPQDYCGGRDEIAAMLIHDCYITPSAAIIRRAALDKVGGFDLRMRAGDWDLWIRLAMQFGDFVFFKEPSACYRVHGTQDSQNFYATLDPLTNHMRILEKVLALDQAKQLAPHVLAILDHIKRRFAQYPPTLTDPLMPRMASIEKAFMAIQQGIKRGNHDEPMVSVVIPTRNRPDLLIRAIRSIKEQSYPYVEIIVVNDGGVDLESLLLWLAADAEIVYINFPVNQGVSAARNAAFKAAQGDIIAYLDDDDVFMPDHLQTVVDTLKQDAVRFVFTRSIYVIETLERGQYKEMARGTANDGMRYDKEHLTICNYIPINTWAHWKSCFDQVGYFDETLDNHEDWEFLLRCAQQFDLIHIPKETVEVHNRRESDNAMRRTRHKFIETYNKIYALYSDLSSRRVVEGRAQMLRQLATQGETAPAINFKQEDVSEAERTQQEYLAWRSKHSLQEIDAQLFAERMTLKWLQRPVLHLLVRLNAGEEAQLADTLDTLGAQFYPSWRLTVIAATPAPDAAFNEVANLRWIESPDVNTSLAAMNHMLLEQGDEWWMLLAPGTLLEPHTLLRYGDYINLHPEWKMIYADDDRIGVNGEYCEPRFKPDFNLDLLRSMDYMSPCLFQSGALIQAGGFLDGQEADNYDSVLRMLDAFGETTIGHIDDVLVHLPNNALMGDEAQQRDAVSRHLARCGVQATVVEAYVPGTHRVIYAHPQQPMVSIIIPSRDKLEFIQPCLESVLEKTRYDHYEILLVDNQSSDPDVFEFYRDVQQQYPGKVRVLSWDEAFNFSGMNNLAAREAKGDYLLFLNNDTQIVQAEWLARMLSYGQRTDVGIVGARLVYPETSKLQHAGIVLGMSNVADHPFNRTLSINEPGYMNRAQVDQNYSAVTAACLLIRKQIYEAIGGMDATHLKVLYNDVDLCLRVGKLGYKIVWTPFATVVHHGSSSLNEDERDSMKFALSEARVKQEHATLLQRWLPILGNDPAYNRNLSLLQPGYGIEGTVVIDWDTHFHDRPRLLSSPVSGGSGEYRVIGPFRALSRAGLAQCDVIQMGKMFKTRILMQTEIARAKPDTLLVQTAIDNAHIRALEGYKTHNPEVLRVFALDDLMTQIPKQNAYYRYSFRDAKPRMRKALALCDRAVVSTEPLAELCRPMIEQVHVIPNRLERGLWGDLSSKRRQGKKPRVGWAGAQQHAGDLALIEEVVKATAQQVDWVFFGMCPESLRSHVREFHDFVLSFYDYPAKLASLNLDLAVAPLEIHPFNEAKSNLRLLEYGMLGWPVVCTDIYPYQNAPVKRVTNNDPQVWINAILERVHDLDAAEQEGDQLRHWVLKNYILEDHLDAWLRALVR